MPKQKITKEMVVAAAFELVRNGGLDNMTVKNIAQKLNCSVQPIYSYCENMEGLHREVAKSVMVFIQGYVASYIDKNDFFRSTGHAYVRLAKEEPNIFKIFVTHQRENIASLDDLYRSETNPCVAEFIADSLNISLEKARTLHMNMVIYTVGISTILATATPGIPSEEIEAQLETACQAFMHQALQKE